MNKQWPCVLWLALLLFSSGAQTPPNAAGRWTGGIELSGVKLGFSVDLAQKGAGQWAGTISIPAQGMQAQALSNVTVKDGQVAFALPDVPGNPTFTGRLSADGQTLNGELTQSGKTFPFRLARASENAPDRYGATPAQGEPGKGFSGSWQGTLDAGAMRLRLIFRVTQPAEDRVIVSLDSPDQSVTEMKAGSATSKENSLRCEWKRIGAKFAGALNQNGSEIIGEFEQNGMTFPLTLKRLAADKTKP